MTHYPSWYQMTREGLVEKQRAAPKKNPVPALALRRVGKELEKAFALHDTLTRAQVHDLEQIAATIQKILDQIDRNDMARAS